jgi:hypothetical protein
MMVRKMAVLALLMSMASAMVAQAPAKPKPLKPRNPRKVETYSATASAAYGDSLKAEAMIAKALRNVSAEHIRQLDLKLVSFGTRHTMSATEGPLGIGAARAWIKEEFERISKDCGDCLEVQTDEFTQPVSDRIDRPTQIVNVYAIQRGTDPEQAKRIFLVTGHYDSRNSDAMDTTKPAPGANDDASGTCVSLESARVLSKLKFPATIIYLTVAGEEQGLYGSEHFAKMAKEKGWQIDGALNNDIVGGNRTPGDKEQDPSIVRVFSEGIPSTATEKERNRLLDLGYEDDGISRQLARYVRIVGRAYLPQAGPGRFQPKLVFRQDRFLRGGDHISFNEAGFPAIRFTEYREDFNHQHQTVRTEKGIEYADLPKFVDFDYVANVVRLNAATLASLAAAPAAPSNVRMSVKDLENVTQLAWDSVAGASGYEVLWRATTSPEWENVESFGEVTRATLPHSKDNVIFGVRAVGDHGHKSLVVVPQPVRSLDSAATGIPNARDFGGVGWGFVPGMIASK